MATWVERRRITGYKAEFRGVQSKSDKNGQRVCAHIVTSYDAEHPAPYVQVWHEDLSGNRFDEQDHPFPSEDGKELRADDLTMMVAGANVHIQATVHGDAPVRDRDAIVFELVLVGWYTPWPGQGMAGEPEGAATYIPIGEPIVNGPTKEEIAAEVIRQLKAEMGGELRDVLEQKSKDAIAENGVLTEHMFAGGQGSFQVSEQLKNRAYAGSLGALKRAGLYDGEVPQ